MYKNVLFSLIIVALLGSSSLANQACDKKVPDFTGKEICIPPKIDKIIITCYGGGSQEIALFMGADKIIAHPDTKAFEEFLKIYPDLKNVPSVGTFNDVNLETLLKLQPTIVFAGITSSMMNERIHSAGIPVYTLGIGKHSLKSLLEEFDHVGAILNKKQKADAIINYWNTTLALIDKHLAKIEPSKRKKVFYTSAAGKMGAESPKSWGDEFIESAGGINVAAKIPFQGGVNSEVLNVWNPDVIITTTNGKNNLNVEGIQKDPALSQLKAVKEKQLYQAPIGTFWWDRPSPESILGILWLSKILYPEAMKDINLKRETKDFYKKFYGYTLTDKEYEGFFTNHTKDIK
ncbi:MAG: ABC transporter substrate-binding protein [Sulfuricurvum sp.]|nr:ABC transporter substrate-binding protein [Sulfuricurvum sp.]